MKGRRLALLALETVYGQPVAGRSPQLLKARRGPGPGQVLLHFAHAAVGDAVRVQDFALPAEDTALAGLPAAPFGPQTLND